MVDDTIHRSFPPEHRASQITQASQRLAGKGFLEFDQEDTLATSDSAFDLRRLRSGGIA
jgi:hypothetical protein